jgi:hypothetical protein
LFMKFLNCLNKMKNGGAAPVRSASKEKK